MPERTTERNVRSPATSHWTSTFAIGMPPPANGSGASRVHKTTLSGHGSPEATPSENGYARKTGWAKAVTGASGCKTAAAPSFQAMLSNSRRDIRDSAPS